MYLSNELISKRVKSAKRLLIVGGIFTAMSVYGIVAGLAGNAKLRSGLATYLVMLVMFGAVFLLGILNQNQTAKAVCHHLFRQRYRHHPGSRSGKTAQYVL